MNINKFLLFTLVSLAAAAGLAEETPPVDAQLPPAEGWSPFGFAFVPVRGIEWPGPGCDVDGFEFALIAGHHREVTGVDLATFGCWTDGNLNGLALAGLGTVSDGAAFGVHLASIFNYANDEFSGLQLSMVNSAYRVYGLQAGVINCVSDGRGVQLGLWNLAEQWRGLQIGLINMAMNYQGVQLGMGNVIGNSPLTACIVLNAWF